MPEVNKSHDELLNRRSFLKVMAAGAGGFVLVSCAAPAATEEAPAEAEEATAAPAAEESPAEEASPAAEAEARTLRVAWGGGPATLDPLTASADVEIALLAAIYDYLIDTNNASELVPRLATAWEVSDDGLTYTLTLAEGAAFHDGSPLTAQDVVWTFERLRGEDSSARDLYTNVTAIEAGEGTVTFTLSEPNPDFLYDLSDNRAVILQEGAQDIGSTFNGTGPFVLESFAGDDRAVLSANADYFLGAPPVSGLEFIYFADNQAAINALRSEAVDVVLRVDNATFLSLEPEGFTAVDVATNGHDLVRLRADRAPGDDVRVRQAFKHATDRERIFQTVQFGFGAVGRDTPIGPLYSDYFLADSDLQPHDPARARELLAEAGYPDGLELTLYVPNLPDRVALAQALQAQWAEAGINVEIQAEEEAVYYADDVWLEVDLAITPWGSRPRPQFYLDVAYQTGAVWNEAHLSSPELDALIETAGTSLDEAERQQAYTEIQQLLTEIGPVIIPYFFASFGVMTPEVEGVEVHPFPGRTNFANASFAG